MYENKSAQQSFVLNILQCLHAMVLPQSCARYQINQLGSKTAPESTIDEKLSNTCGVSK